MRLHKIGPNFKSLVLGSQKHIKVTASHAIFPRDGGNEAPGSVVGFQIDHAAFYRRFSEITSKHNVSVIQLCSSAV